MATSQYERPVRSEKLPDIFRTAAGVNMDIGPMDRLRDSVGTRKSKATNPTQETESPAYPRIILRDRLGRVLDTFTSLQEAIYRAKWNVKQSGQAHNPLEWRLPKAPLPARPDYTRALPPIRPHPHGIISKHRELGKHGHGKVMEFDVDDVGFVQESLQHMPFVPSLSFLRQEILVGPKTYFQIVGTMLLHKRILTQTEKRQAIYNFPGFCSGCVRQGLCYGCERSTQPHFHEDKAMRTGGGFTYYKKDRPENEMTSKHPSNWKLLHPDQALKRLMEEYAGVNLEGDIPEEVKRHLDEHGGAIAHVKNKGKKSRGKRQRLEGQGDEGTNTDMEVDEGILPDIKEGQGDDEGHEFYGGEGHETIRSSGRGLRTEDIKVNLPEPEDDDEYDLIHEGEGHDKGQGRKTKRVRKAKRTVGGSGIDEIGDDKDHKMKGTGRGQGDTEGPRHRLTKYRERDTDDEMEDSDDGDGRQRSKGHTRESRKRERLYKAPPPFVPKKSPTRRLEAKSPFSSERKYNLSLEKSFSVRKSGKSPTKFVDFNNRDVSWKEPKKFELKKNERKGTEFWSPPPSRPKKNERKYRSVSPSMRSKRKPSPSRLSPDSGMESELMTGFKRKKKRVDGLENDPDLQLNDLDIGRRRKLKDKSSNRSNRSTRRGDVDGVVGKDEKSENNQSGDRKRKHILPPLVNLSATLKFPGVKARKKKNKLGKTPAVGSTHNLPASFPSRPMSDNAHPLDDFTDTADRKRVQGRQQRSLSLAVTNGFWSGFDSTVREELEPVREVTPPAPTPPPVMDRVATPSGIRLPTPEKPRTATPTKKPREIIKKERKQVQPGPKPPTPKPVTPPSPPPEPELEREPTPELREEPVRAKPPLPDLPPIEIPELPEYQPAEKSDSSTKKVDRRTLIEVTPEVPEPSTKLKGPPKLAPRLKPRSTPRKQKVAEAPVTTTEIQQMTDPLDFLAKYCIINPERLPYYERVFGDATDSQTPRYSREPLKERGAFVSLPPAQLSQHELKMLKDLTVLNHAQSPAREGLTPPEQYLEKLNYTMEMLTKKREDLMFENQRLTNEKNRVMAEMAKAMRPSIVRLDYQVKQSKKKKHADPNLLCGTELVISYDKEMDAQSVTSLGTTGTTKTSASTSSKKKKKPRNLEDYEDSLESKPFLPQTAKDITDEVIVSRIDDKMKKKIKKDPAVKRLTMEMQRKDEKDQYLQERLAQIDDEKDLVGLYCMDYYFSEQMNSARPHNFRRQQSRLYQKLHPDPDIQMNIEEVQAVLQQINNHLMTDKEFEYLYLILNLPKREKINFRLFSIIAALSEKVTQMDPVIRKLINKFDYNALDIKMEKSKELFELLHDTDSLPSGNALASTLAVELTAGGLTPEHTSYVLSKFNREGKGFIDFLDFVTYVPLFIEIHQRIIRDPLNETLSI